LRTKRSRVRVAPGALKERFGRSFCFLNEMTPPHVLLTNDDGIRSPGLWAAAEVLSALGEVTVAAPREQSSGTGRSMPVSSDGKISREFLELAGRRHEAYAVGGTPAQAVLHGIFEIIRGVPALVVAGINYGENVGSGVTISGTVGAVLEAASHGIPGLAVSLEMPVEQHLTYSTEPDFAPAAHFTAYFAGLLLTKTFPPDVMALKVDVPSDATPETPWHITRLASQRYFEAVPPTRVDWSEPGLVGYRHAPDVENSERDSDVYVLLGLRHVSVTPLSLDLTSRVDFSEMDRLLRE
jgi:5'/3'-nucleotidase